MQRTKITSRVIAATAAMLAISAGWSEISKAAQEPELTIISPAPGEVIIGNTVRVVVAIPLGYALDDNHLHLWLDAMPSHEETTSIVLADAPEYAYTAVFSGLHTLRVELFKNDHLPYEPRLTSAVEFETVGEELKPALGKDKSGGAAPPEVRGGLFLPRGKSNTIFSIVLVVLGVAILWYVFGRSEKK